MTCSRIVSTSTININFRNHFVSYYGYVAVVDKVGIGVLNFYRRRHNPNFATYSKYSTVGSYPDVINTFMVDFSVPT